MTENWVIPQVMKVFILITCPVTFFVGVFLLFDIETYLKIEGFLSKSYHFSKKTWVSWLEANRQSLQMFLLRRRRSLGILCLLNAILVFWTNFMLFKKS